MLKNVINYTRQPQPRQDAPFPSKAAGKKQPEAHPLGYVEHFFDPRTKLGTFFSILNLAVIDEL
jgi:hypothetical protein